MYWMEDLSKVDKNESYSFLITEDRELISRFVCPRIHDNSFLKR